MKESGDLLLVPVRFNGAGSSGATLRPVGPVCVHSDLQAHKQVNGNRPNPAGDMKFEEFYWMRSFIPPLPGSTHRIEG